MNVYGDGFATLYEHYFNSWIRLFAPGLNSYLRELDPAGTRLLDLCCGTGETASHLCADGWKVVGVDRSAAMLAIAREKLAAHLADGSAELIEADAEDFVVNEPAHACICIDGALNHLETVEALKRCFSRVRDALTVGAPFVFDMLEAEHFAGWKEMSLVEDDQAMFVRHGSWDPEANVALLHITGALGGGPACWRISETLASRTFSDADVREALAEAGFAQVPSLLEDPRGRKRTIRCAIKQ